MDIVKGDIYQSGSDIIISSSSVFARPFVEFTNSYFPSINELSYINLNTFDNANILEKIKIDEFFSKYFSYSNMFVELITNALSENIRRTSVRDDIKQKTTISLASEIRSESFNEFDNILGKYSNIMKELGIQLENTSTFKSAVDGALKGGGIQYLFTKGRSGTGGLIAGALIGAVMEEMKKQQLREKLILSSKLAIIESINILESISLKLYDQYSTYVMGSKIDFEQRDNFGKIIKSEISKITSNCLKIVENIITLNSTILKINTYFQIKKKKGKMFASTSRMKFLKFGDDLLKLLIKFVFILFLIAPYLVPIIIIYSGKKKQSKAYLWYRNVLNKIDNLTFDANIKRYNEYRLLEDDLNKNCIPNLKRIPADLKTSIEIIENINKTRADFTEN